MVRFWSILVFGVTGYTALTPAPAWSQQPRPATPSPSRVSGELAGEALPRVPGTGVPAQDDWIAVTLGAAVPKLDSAELAGTAPGTRLDALTLEQAYTLTLIRTHAPAIPRAASPVEIFDPKALDEQARRWAPAISIGSAHEFLSSGFRDPCAPSCAVPQAPPGRGVCARSGGARAEHAHLVRRAPPRPHGQSRVVCRSISSTIIFCWPGRGSPTSSTVIARRPMRSRYRWACRRARRWYWTSAF